jgi:molecular chaperone GrpE
MFFKKNKSMKDKTNQQDKHGHENADNMTHNEEQNETTQNEQHTHEHPEHETHMVESDEDKIQKLQDALEEMKDKHLRMVAEFDNFRRRTAKERMELTQTAGKEVLQSLLSVLDDVERASKQLETTTDLTILKEGISLVFNKFRATLQQKGLKAMDAVNTEFNPDLHEAITEIPAPSPKMVGKVIDVVENGYYLNDKLIRFAKVVVGK